jgi:hypothetical protein
MEIVIGALASLVVQFLKTKLGTDTFGTMLAVLMISFVGAATYVLLVDTAIWPTLLQVIITAGAFYAYIIKRFV